MQVPPVRVPPVNLQPVQPQPLRMNQPAQEIIDDDIEMIQPMASKLKPQQNMMMMGGPPKQ